MREFVKIENVDSNLNKLQSVFFITKLKDHIYITSPNLMSVYPGSLITLQHFITLIAPDALSSLCSGAKVPSALFEKDRN